MPEYKKPTSQQEFDANFAQKNPLMNPTEAYYESSRCLFCYDAPCIKACPTGIDIPLFIKQIHTENTTGSAKTIFNANWLGNACGVVCPTGVLCEGACVYNHQDVPPIQIGRLQNYATNAVIKQNKPLFSIGESTGKKIAIIGAGPAGIACACELCTLGYEVEIFEAKGKPSGLNYYGVAPYKITNQEVLDEIDYLQEQLKFKIHYSSEIDSTEKIKALENNFHAIFLGVGLGKTAALKLKGEDKHNVIGAVEFIEKLRVQQHKTQVADQVIVLGGGNTAMDAASESARMGASKVTLAYRRTKKDMGAYGFEYDLAISSGVTSLFNATPIEILGNGSVEGVRFVKTEMKKGKLHPLENSEFTLPCQMVIMATGQAKQGDLYKLIEDFKIDHQTRITVDPKTFQTSNKKYFAGGDAINGGSEVVNAAYDGKMAARSIDDYLSCKV